MAKEKVAHGVLALGPAEGDVNLHTGLTQAILDWKLGEDALDELAVVIQFLGTCARDERRRPEFLFPKSRRRRSSRPR